MSSTSSATPVSTPTLSPEAQAARAAETNLPFILGMTITFFILAFVAVCLRTYVRLRIVKVMGRDDYTIIAAMLCSIGGMIVFSIQSRLGLGRHQDTISKENMKHFRLGNLIYACLSAVLGMDLVRISISFLLMRFVQHKIYRGVLWGIIIFMVLFTIACWGTLIFFCIPVKAFWDVDLRKLPTTKCYPLVHFTNISLMNTAFNMFTDVLLATLPAHIIWNLQISRRQKISLIGVLSLGYAAVALGVVKAIHQFALPTRRDQTFPQGVQMWGFVQLNVSIVAACMPALRPLFHFLADSLSSPNRTPGRTTGDMQSGYFRRYESGAAGGSSGLRSMATDGNAINLKDYPNQDTERGINSSFVTSRDDKTWTDRDEDAGSEEGILPLHGTGGIVRTTEFTVK